MQIRCIIGLASPDSRRELTTRTLIEMDEEQQACELRAGLGGLGRRAARAAQGLGRRTGTARAHIMQAPVAPCPQKHFEETVKRICQNLSIQRNAKDMEVYKKVLEVRGFIDAHNQPYGASNDFSQL